MLNELGTVCFSFDSIDWFSFFIMSYTLPQNLGLKRLHMIGDEMFNDQLEFLEDN